MYVCSPDHSNGGQYNKHEQHKDVRLSHDVLFPVGPAVECML